jgi:ribosomal protein S30
MGGRGQLVDKGVTTTNFPTGEVRRKPATPDLQSKPAGGYTPNRKNRNEACV